MPHPENRDGLTAGTELGNYSIGERSSPARGLKGTIPVGPVAAGHIVIGTATDASMPVTADSSQPAAVCAAVAGSKRSLAAGLLARDRKLQILASGMPA